MSVLLRYEILSALIKSNRCSIETLTSLTQEAKKYNRRVFWWIDELFWKSETQTKFPKSQLSWFDIYATMSTKKRYQISSSRVRMKMLRWMNNCVCARHCHSCYKKIASTCDTTVTCPHCNETDLLSEWEISHSDTEGPFHTFAKKTICKECSTFFQTMKK
jgi:hypothetical protein